MKMFKNLLLLLTIVNASTTHTVFENRDFAFAGFALISIAGFCYLGRKIVRQREEFQEQLQAAQLQAAQLQETQRVRFQEMQKECVQAMQRKQTLLTRGLEAAQRDQTLFTQELQEIQEAQRAQAAQQQALTQDLGITNSAQRAFSKSFLTAIDRIREVEEKLAEEKRYNIELEEKLAKEREEIGRASCRERVYVLV